MAGKVRSIRASGEWWEMMEIRAKQAGYENVNALIVGEGRYDAIIQKPHPMTAPLALKSPGEQKKIDGDLLRLVKLGRPAKGSFFEHILQRVKDGTSVEKAIQKEADENSLQE